MTAEETIEKIQYEINQIKITCDYADIDDWVWDHIVNLQEILNDYKNAWAKSSEPDPFN